MYKKHHNVNQRGVATLGITLMLLFIMTLVALYTAKTSIKEQQISANQYRAEQSLSTANAALDWGVAYYRNAKGSFCEKETEVVACLAENGMCILSETLADIQGGIVTDAKCVFIYNENEDNILYIDPNATEDTHHKNALSRGRSEMYYAFVEVDEDCNGDEVIGGECDHIPIKGGGVPDIYKTPVKVYGVGHSDDDTGERTVSVTVDTGNIFGEDGPGGIKFPLITRSVTEKAAGGISVINRYDNRTISSGDALDILGSLHTYVAKPSLNCNDKDPAIRAKCIKMTKDLTTDMEASEKGSAAEKPKSNADIIEANSNLSNLTIDEYFFNFFGKTKSGMKDFIADDNGGVYPGTKGWAELIAEEETLIWIEGDYDVTGSAGDVLGSDEHPVVLIVNGNVKFGGNIDIIGIVYVIGEWDPGSNNAFRGIVIVEGGFSPTGGGDATIVYDADLLTGAVGVPPGTVAGITSGTWIDI